MGYKIGRFVVDGANIESFKCGICHDVLKVPVIIRTCQHTYCRECIEEWIQTHKSCPKDRKSIKQRDLDHPSRAFRNNYDGLKIKCDFTRNGCQEVVTLGQLKSHVISCEFNKVACKQNCGFVAPRGQFRTRSCVDYLKSELEIAKNRPLMLEKVEIEVAKDALKMLETSIQQNGSVLDSATLVSYFKEELSNQDMTGDISLFQFQWSHGFSENDRQQIIYSVAHSIVQCNSVCEISPLVQARLSAELRESSLHVIVGHRKFLAMSLKDMKFVTVYIANVKVVVFVNITAFR